MFKMEWNKVSNLPAITLSWAQQKQLATLSAIIKEFPSAFGVGRDLIYSEQVGHLPRPLQCSI